MLHTNGKYIFDAMNDQPKHNRIVLFRKEIT